VAELLNTGIATTQSDSLMGSYPGNLMSGADSQVVGGDASAGLVEPTTWTGFYLGAAFGTLVGVLLGALMARGMYMVIPAFGLVIPGPLGGAICGAMSGFATGGIIGVLAAVSMREPIRS
jgi:hypothetical protein